MPNTEAVTATQEATDLLRGSFYEELTVGQLFNGAAVTVTESMVTSAVGLFQDLALLHRDHRVARDAGFRGPIAPGALTLGLCIAPIALIAGNASASHLEDSIRYRNPVYAGDTLDTTFEITRMEPKTRFGLVEYTATVINQNGDLVAEIVTLMAHKYELPRDAQA